MVSALVLATLLQISVKAARLILSERRRRMAASAVRARNYQDLKRFQKKRKRR